MIHEWFSKISKWVSEIVAHPATLAVAVMSITVWIVGGLVYGFTSYYLEVLVVSMELIAILLLLLLQRDTNVSTNAIQLKLNELLRVDAGGVRLDIEDKSDAERAQAQERDQEDTKDEPGPTGS